MLTVRMSRWVQTPICTEYRYCTSAVQWWHGKLRKIIIEADTLSILILILQYMYLFVLFCCTKSYWPCATIASLGCGPISYPDFLLPIAFTRRSVIDQIRLQLRRPNPYNSMIRMWSDISGHFKIYIEYFWSGNLVAILCIQHSVS
jgi:hypothetical protein